MVSTHRMPVYFISHGGGPWPWIEGKYKEAYQKLKESLEEIPRELPEKPKAILVVSGHWEEDIFKVMSNPNPPMVYDYTGFPDYTYKIKYAAPGSPELAKRIGELLTEAGMSAVLDANRGFDHGAFAPLAVSYPKADVPVLQLSLKADYNPAIHIKAGRALSRLRDEGVLIIGSGLSYHNLGAFDQRAQRPSREFDTWLQETLIQNSVQERTEKLLAWEKAPSARFAHPQEDHLLPLMVAVGAAESDKASLCYHEDDFMGGITVSSFRFDQE